MTQKQELKLILCIVAITLGILIVVGIIAYDPNFAIQYPEQAEGDEAVLGCCCCCFLPLTIVAALLLSTELDRYSGRRRKG